jgi:dephospho-CoA kinase
MKNKEKLIIGITGGIGAGKTTFANLIKEKGFDVIFTDDLAKKIIAENEKIQNQLITEFGKDTFIDNCYNVDYISNIVFSDVNKLNKLNQIVIPNVIDTLMKEIELLQDGCDGLIFVETALLYEMGLADGFDYIISVSSKLENKINRIKQRNNITHHKIENRINSQISQEEKNKLADFIVENDKDIPELMKSVESIINILKILPNRET